MDPIWIAPIILLGLVGFAGFWVAIIRVIAAIGWSKLARRYTAPHDPPPTARLYAAQSLWVGGASYRNTVNIWIDPSGVFLRPLLIFSMFHPMLLIRWHELRAVGERGNFLTKRVEIDLGGDSPGLAVYGASAGALLDQWRSRSH